MCLLWHARGTASTWIFWDMCALPGLGDGARLQAACRGQHTALLMFSAAALAGAGRGATTGCRGDGIVMQQVSLTLRAPPARGAETA